MPIAGTRALKTPTISVIIANEIFRRAVPAETPGDLPRKPLGCRVSGHRGRQQPFVGGYTPFTS